METEALKRQPFARARAGFPGAERNVYLDVAARGLLSRQVRAAIDAYLEQRMEGGDKAAMFATAERARGRFAQLVHAEPDEVAFTKNVSDGLNMIAMALPWQAGDNVVLCPELEHPNNVYPWLNLQRLRGIEVRAVPPREGHISAAAIAAAIDARTRVVSVSTVTFAPGFRADMDALGEVCRERGVFLLADGAQSVGVLHTDLARTAIDGLAVSTQKGLLGLYGMGFLYCRREWAERLAPAALARFGVDLGEAHEAAMGTDDYRLMPGARRFDLGNYNFTAAAAADASLALLLELGTPAIEAHVLALAARLARGFLALDLPVCGGEPGTHSTHLVTVGEIGAGQHDTSDDSRLNGLYAHLTANGVKLSIRRGILRFSLHLYNNEADVARVLALTGDWLQQTGA